MIVSLKIWPAKWQAEGDMRYSTGLRIALLILFCACAAFAQRDLATLAGTVTDASGGVVPNAKVTITEIATGQVYSILTNNLGEFVRPALKPSTRSADR